MNNRIQLFLLAVVLTAWLLLANVFVQSRMHQIIKEDKLVDAGFVQEGAPPVVAFTTVALGGFRGLIADILWLRLIALQDEGKFFEMVQLADWIQKLQPKFAGASAYLGWNMAYNISVTCKRQEDRWRWIHRGIEVLRDAISMSPNDPELYKELGWIYQHKLGNVMDDAQRYYKYEMAKELIFLYGTRYPDWEAFAKAPETEEEFRQTFGKDHVLWTSLKDAGYPTLKDVYQEFRLKGGLPEKLAKTLSDKDAAELELYLRVKWLREKFLIDPKVALKINREYGDLDWLLPETFAIYWATQGLDHTEDHLNLDCERMIVQSLTVSFTNGRMLLPGNQASMSFMLVPNTAVAPALQKSFDKAFEHGKVVVSFRASFQNFLTDATVILFSYGRKQEAYEYYKQLCKEFIGKQKAQPELFLPFVLSKWEEDLRDGGYKQGQQQINALIFRACQLLAYGDRDAAAAHLELAKRAYDNYMVNYTEDRVALPPFNEMKRNATLNIIENFPEIAARLKAELESQQEEPASSTVEPVKP